MRAKRADSSGTPNALTRTYAVHADASGGVYRSLKVETRVRTPLGLLPKAIQNIQVVDGTERSLVR